VDVVAPRVARRWPSSTIVCAASGPSLTEADLAYVRGKAPLIAVNDVYRLAPWADALVAADASWWLAHEGVPGFAGEKWSIEHVSWSRLKDRWPDVKRLKCTGHDGIETEPTGLRSGRNTGALAIGLAVHYGASLIVLLGYDMGHSADGPSHFFGHHKGSMRQSSPYGLFKAKLQTMVAPLKALNIAIVNCSRTTALECFPRQPLESVL
jgi:hypothetical protein